MKYLMTIGLNVLGMVLLALSIGTAEIGTYNWWIVVISATVFNIAGGILYGDKYN